MVYTYIYIYIYIHTYIHTYMYTHLLFNAETKVRDAFAGTLTDA